MIRTPAFQDDPPQDYLWPDSVKLENGEEKYPHHHHVGLEQGIKAEGDYQCNMCDYETTSLANFKRHMGSKTHEGAQLDLLRLVAT